MSRGRPRRNVDGKPQPFRAASVVSLKSLLVLALTFLGGARIEAEILADGSSGVTTEANTEFSKPASKAPSYEAENGKITKFNGKFTFKGTIQIRTSYASDANAKTLSCYGRGTTDTDVKNRDITLGFHESCHRADYEAYAKANALPDTPAMSVGMKAADYDAAAAAFVKVLNKYWADMTADSIKKTDEVGFMLSKGEQDNSCYVHEVPQASPNPGGRAACGGWSSYPS